ncbi:hypothetical protein ACVWXU_002091 [Streptomyces sp. TE33382]
MPATGKHRRTKTGPIVRGVLAAGTGGAVLALPLIGATGAHAAEKAAPTAASVAAAHTAPGAAATAHGASKSYSVVSGDYLSKIAAEHKLKGGWQKLYQDNREVVGENPSLIFPGMKLTLGAEASGSADAAQSAPAPSKAEPKKAAPAAPAAPKVQSAPKAASSAGSSAPSSEAGKSTTSTSTSASQSNSSGWTTPVANANVTTQYRASGASWSSGYHTGSDFQGRVGHRRPRHRSGHRGLGRLERLVRQRGRHQARRRHVLPVRAPVLAQRLRGPDRHRRPADRPLRLHRQLDRPAPPLRGPHRPELRLGRRPGRVPAPARRLHLMER